MCIRDSVNQLQPLPFEAYEGTAAWRQLVKICSGLDSFMMGELQVMSQFRKSINFHKERGLISHYNSGFFEHVVAANRSIRKQLGFHQHHRIHAVLGHHRFGCVVERTRSDEGGGFGLWRHGHESR